MQQSRWVTFSHGFHILFLRVLPGQGETGEIRTEPFRFNESLLNSSHIRFPSLEQPRSTIAAVSLGETGDRPPSPEAIRRFLPHRQRDVLVIRLYLGFSAMIMIIPDIADHLQHP